MPRGTKCPPHHPHRPHGPHCPHPHFLRSPGDKAGWHPATSSLPPLASSSAGRTLTAAPAEAPCLSWSGLTLSSGGSLQSRLPPVLPTLTPFPSPPLGLCLPPDSNSAGISPPSLSRCGPWSSGLSPFGDLSSKHCHLSQLHGTPREEQLPDESAQGSGPLEPPGHGEPLTLPTADPHGVCPAGSLSRPGDDVRVTTVSKHFSSLPVWLPCHQRKDIKYA